MKTETYFIGADLGTSSLKLSLCENNGTVISSITEEYSVQYPKPGWSEQDPADWWKCFCNGIQKLICGIDRFQIQGIALSGQMHGLVILDEKDEVLRPAILWNDSRTQKEVDYLNTAIGYDKLIDMTGNIAYAGFTAPKLLWVKNHESDIFSKIHKIMLPKDYINYKLTGVHATDFSDASGTLLLDVKNKRWQKDMLHICNIREDQMPLLFESYQPIGTLLPSVSEKLGLSPDTVVAAGAGDNAGAAIGNETFGNGKCNISLGTSGTIFVSSDHYVYGEYGLHSFCHADGKYHLMACMLSCALCNKWFCDNVLKADDYQKIQSSINEDSLGENNVYFLPYLMGERSPINDTDATGVFIGLRPDTKAEDMMLAIFEGVAFAIRDNIELVHKMGVDITAATVCGGGAKSPLWLKILANILNIELCVPVSESGPSLGAAYIAMLASGEYTSVEKIPKVKMKERIIPQGHLCLLYNERYQKFKKIYPTIKNLFKELKD